MEPETRYANRLWGRGQTIRLFWRWWHGRVGHRWGQWNVEPPEDELGRFISPEPDMMVFCFRGCEGDCGAVQHINCRFKEVEELPT